MFNVLRKEPAPACLLGKNYNHPSVIDTLHSMFLGKCYLCESDNLQAPEVEHFIPHKDDDSLKYDWLNLFYSCARCNSIKSHTHIELLDCTHPFTDVFNEIIHVMPSIPSQAVTIKPSSNAPSQLTLNTVTLLDKCFNLENSSLRGVTRASLLENLFSHYEYFLEQRMTLINKRSSNKVINDALDNLGQMCKDYYPFSVFWKWHLILDSVLIARHPRIKSIF